MINLKLPSYLTCFIDKSRGSKCRAWYILNCIKYINQNNIDITAYYEGMNTNERITNNDPRGES